jgi:hypothetical protein
MTSTATIIPTTSPTSAPTMAPPTAARETGARRRAIGLGLLISAQFVVMLDTSIVNVALPSIQADMSLSSNRLSWIVNAYVLTFGGLLLLFGRVADLLGRRRMFIAGSAAFTLGTLVAATAVNEWMLVAGRVIQGAGAAADAELPRRAAGPRDEPVGRLLGGGRRHRRIRRRPAHRDVRMVLSLLRDRAGLDCRRCPRSPRP